MRELKRQLLLRARPAMVGRTLPRVRELKQPLRGRYRWRSGRTLPRVRELKLKGWYVDNQLVRSHPSQGA